MGLFDLPVVEEGKTTDETVSNMFETMYKLKKELDYILTNLDSVNIGNVDGLKGVLSDPQVPRIENVQDIMASTLYKGKAIDITYDDPNGKLTIDVDIGEFEEAPEFVVEEGDIENLDISSTYDELEIQALRDKCEMLAADCRGLRETVNDLIVALKGGI